MSYVQEEELRSLQEAHVKKMTRLNYELEQVRTEGLSALALHIASLLRQCLDHAHMTAGNTKTTARHLSGLNKSGL